MKNFPRWLKFSLISSGLFLIVSTFIILKNNTISCSHITNCLEQSGVTIALISFPTSFITTLLAQIFSENILQIDFNLRNNIQWIGVISGTIQYFLIGLLIHFPTNPKDNHN